MTTPMISYIKRIRIELPDYIAYQDDTTMESNLFEALSAFFDTENIVVEVLN